MNDNQKLYSKKIEYAYPDIMKIRDEYLLNLEKSSYVDKEDAFRIIGIIDEFISKDASHKYALQDKMQILSTIGHQDDVISIYKKDEKYLEDRLFALLIVANSYIRKSDYAQSLSFLEKALPLVDTNKDNILTIFDLPQRTSAFIFNSLGVCYRQKEMYAESNNYFLKALDIEPNNHIFFGNLAKNSIHTNNLEQAEKYIKRMDSINSDSYYSFLIKTEYYMEKGMLKESLENMIHAWHSKDRVVFFDTDPGELLDELISKQLNQTPGVMNLVDFIETSLVENNSLEYAAFFGVKIVDTLVEQCRDKNISSRIIELMNKDPSLSSFNVKRGIFDILKRKNSNIINTIKIKVPEPYSKDFIIKINNPEKSTSSEKERIKNEYFTNLWLYTLFDDVAQPIMNDVSYDIILVARPIVCLEDKNHAFFVQQRINRTNLEEFFNSDSSIKDKKNNLMISIASLTYLHLLGTNDLKRDAIGEYFVVADGQNNSYTVRLKSFDYYKNFMERAISGKKNDKYPRLGKNSEFNNFYKKFMHFFREPDLRYLIHGDAYPANTLIDGAWVDFEKAVIGDPGIDLVYLTKNHAINIEGLDAYIYFLNESSKKFSVPIKYQEISEIRHRYPKNIIYSDLCQLGTMLSVNDIPNARFYFNRLLNDMQGKLKDDFVAFIKETKHEELKELL